MLRLARRRRLGIPALLACAACLIALRWWATPHVLGGTIEYDQVALPFSRFVALNGLMPWKRINVDIAVPPLALQRTFIIHSSACVWELHVNDHDIPHEELCSYMGTAVDLHGALMRGVNHISVSAYPENDYFFQIRPRGLFWLTTLIDLLAAGCVGAAAWLLLRRKSQEIRLWAMLMLGAIMLRVWYIESTPYFVRAWDWNDHLDYVRYMLEHWAIPSAAAAPQFFQAPFYYIIASVWAFIMGVTVTGSYEFLVMALRPASALFSLLSLGCAAWISRLLFAGKKEMQERLTLFAIFAVFPGVLFFASRISNETLLFPLSLISFGLLLQWWRTRDAWWWHINAMIVAIGLLTKTTMLPLALTPVVCLFVSGQSLKKRAVLLASLIGFSAVTTAWLLLMRYAIDGYYEVVQTRNMESGSPGLFTQNALTNLLTFNPFMVLAKPFNWNWTSEYRPHLFLEYFFKSGYTGEWLEHPHALWPLRAALALHMAGLIAAAIGLWDALRTHWRATLPTAVIGAMLFGVLLLNRLINRYLTGQDFRYVALMIIPVTYYVFRGVRVLEQKTGMRLFWLTWVYCACALLYVAVLIRDGTVLGVWH